MKSLRQFRAIALLEGVSFLILLFIAMPLKYVAGMPLTTRIFGSVHGLLFVLFVAALIRVSRDRHWPFRRSFAAFVSSLLPFGTLVFDRAVRHEMEERRPARAVGNAPAGSR
jgi:integral membrane protein